MIPPCWVGPIWLIWSAFDTFHQGHRTLTVIEECWRFEKACTGPADRLPFLALHGVSGGGGGVCVSAFSFATKPLRVSARKSEWLIRYAGETIDFLKVTAKVDYIKIMQIKFGVSSFFFSKHFPTNVWILSALIWDKTEKEKFKS